MPRKHLIASGISKKQQDQAKIWLKCAKEIKAAAKLGTNPESNYKLKAAIERALNNNLSRDSIEKNINGATKDPNSLKELIFEIFGPQGSNVIIKCLTDNENRTLSAIRGYCSKYNMNIGKPNSVMINYNENGIFCFKSSLTEDELLELLLDYEIIEINNDNDEYEVLTSKKDFFSVKDTLVKNNIDISFSEIKLIPNEYLEVNEEVKDKLFKFISICNEDDDVQSTETNVN